MRAFIASLLSTLALCAFAGQTQLTNLRPTHLVVTNEQDATALSALATTSTAVRALLDIETGLRTQADADLSAALSASNTAARSAITNEAALRSIADAALLSSNTVLTAALTNEAALRAQADASLFSSNTEARSAITNEAAIRALADATNSESLHALIYTSQVTIVHDTLDHHVFTRYENATGVTYRVSDPSWWAIQDGNANPHTELPYPLELGTFGVFQVSLDAENITNIWFESIANVVELSESTHYEWPDWNTVLDYHSVTTEISRVATKNDIGSGLSAVRLNPVVSNLYADLASTNVAGYASFSTANPASMQTVTVIPNETIGTNTVGLRYDIGSDGFISARAITYGRAGGSIKEWATVLTLHDAAGVALTSNVFNGAIPTSAASTLPYFTNSLTWAGAWLTNAYLTLSCTMAKTNSVAVSRIVSGSTTPSTLTLTTTPLPYTTPEQITGKYALQTGGTLTNATLAGPVTIGGVTRTSWPDGGGGTVILESVTNAYGYTTAYVVTNLTDGGAVSTNFFTDRALVPQTGQTNVYYAFYCDGCLLKGFPLPKPRFAALAESGAETNQIRDLLSGLVWDKNAGRSAADLNAMYAVISNMNAETYGGASDWRLPNVRELYSILHFGYYTPAICNTAGTAKWSAGDPFIGVNSATSYSTSSTRIQNTNQLYAVGLGEGGIGLATKQTTMYFWPVRRP